MNKVLFPIFLAGMLLISISAVMAADLDELPYSYSKKLSLAEAPAMKMPELDMVAIAAEDLKNESEGAPYRFAIPLFNDGGVNYKEKGLWTSDGELSVWRLQVDSTEAQSLSFGFDNMFLPKGAKLFIYDENYQQVLGPFTDKDNKSHGQLWTAAIEGKKATVEINIPSKMKPYLKFNLKSINQGYRGFSPLDLAKSGSCNIDVVCTVADPWRDEIRSVAHYVFTRPEGSFVCTGTLVNNVDSDRKPYFLTANHCVSTESVSNTMVFFWNFETSSCDGTPNGSKNQSQTGATLRATWDVSDLTLVELDVAPSNNFNVHWAGWDNNDIAPTSAVAIHHPAGDEKRISFDTDPLTITAYSSNIENSNADYLRVGAWNQGTTEGGSSGSAIWNSDHRVVGTLTGGAASCQALNSPDWYGRVASHWNGGGTQASQLQAWLDPNNTGATTLDGIDACNAPSISFTINPNPAEVGQAVMLTSTVTGGASGNYSYEWDFDGNGTVDSTLANPTYTFNSAYSGNISLSVSDSASCKAVMTSSIVVNNAGGNNPPPPSSGGGGSSGIAVIGLLAFLFGRRITKQLKPEGVI